MGIISAKGSVIVLLSLEYVDNYTLSNCLLHLITLTTTPIH